MPSMSRCFILFSLALFTSALTTPHAIRHANHHIAVVVPNFVVAPHDSLAARTVRRRSNSARCKPKPSSVLPTASKPPANVEGAPPSVTSSHKPTPTPTPTHTSSPALPSGSGGNGVGFIGEGTYYGTGLGACGITNNDDQLIAAVSHLMFDTFPDYKGGNPNNNPICGKKVTATYQGRSVQVTITDRCVACGMFDLDFSPKAFSALAAQSVGRIVGMEWTWS